MVMRLAKNSKKSRNQDRRQVLAILPVLASQSIPSWNQIISWLKEMETLRTIAA